MGSVLGLRVTIVSATGTVIGDSSLDAAGLATVENHAARPEVAQARESGFGTAERESTTVHDDLYYVAARIDRAGQPVGFVRLATPLSEIRRTTGGYDLTLALLSFIALLAIVSIGYFAARRFSHPIEQMSRTADAIAAGEFTRQVEYESEDEIGALGSALNRMTRALSGQIRALSSEKKLRDSILLGMEEGVLVVDRERRILLANGALQRILALRGGDPAGPPDPPPPDEGPKPATGAFDSSVCISLAIGI